MSTATKSTGLVTVKLPKDTLAVITATSDAGYTQSVTVNVDGTKDSFRGTGQGPVPMKLKTGGSEYLKIEPSSTDRDIKLSFYYATSPTSDDWEAPVANGPLYTQSNGIRVIGYGTEDSTDNSFNDTAISIFLFPKITPKKS